MKQFQKRFIVKMVSWVLVFLLFYGNPLLFSQENQEDQLGGLFKWITIDYQKGRYREVLKDLELLLSYFDEDSDKKKNGKREILKGKIYLLMGVTYEKLGQVHKAKENYRLSKEILASQNAAMKIDNLDFSQLEEYQRIMMENKVPVASVAREGIIEKPAVLKKKKHLSPLLVIGGTVVIVGLAAALLLNKKRSEEIDVVINYDVHELGIEWVEIPAGEFMMGDNFNEGDFDEQPVHAVYLDEYYISRYEITFDQYDKFCEETHREKPADWDWGRGNRPVINVSWGDAKAFCDWLSRKIVREIHLPTEAQWEKAARGTDQRRYPWGNSSPDSSKTNHNTDYKTHPVGSYPDGISPYGVHDMAGNVAEWCLDQYDPYYYTASPYNNPKNIPYDPIGRVNYVIRGGSWYNEEERSVRCADRNHGHYYWGVSSANNLKTSYYGFRIVLER
ncbi:MAG: formylglycine-generating enzyme family protein [Candidatus Aminicenantes bacterium]|nr:MAG: formylglycine-generating enzyme family protein [Candidatus Aminicenantes bacterium]